MASRFRVAVFVFMGGWLSGAALCRGSDWLSLTSGSWMDAGNWSAGVPNGVGEAASFPEINSNSYFQVNLPADVTLGSLLTSNYRLEQINGPGRLIFDSSSPGIAPSLSIGAQSSASIRINTQVVLPNNALNINLPTQNNRAYLLQGFAPTAAAVQLNGQGSVTFAGNNSGWTGSLLLNGGMATFNNSASADVTLNGGTLDLRSNYAGDVTFNQGLLTTTAAGSLSGKLILGASNNASYESGRDFQFLGGSEGTGDFVLRSSRNVIIGGAGLGHDGSLRLEASRVTVTAPLHHTGGTLLSQSNTRLTIDPTGSLVGTGPITVPSESILAVAEGAGSNEILHSVSPQSVKMSGGGLSLQADVAPGPFLHADSTGGTILIKGVSNFTAGGQTLDFSQFPNGKNFTLAGDYDSSAPSGLGSALQIIPANQTFRFTGGTGMLEVHATLADTNGQSNAVKLDSTSGLYSGIRLAAVNTYSGLTTVNGGLIEVANVQALGAASVGTKILGAQSYVDVYAPVAEPFELAGGILTIKNGSQGIASPITMNGGQLKLDYPGTFNTPLIVGANVNAVDATTPIFPNGERATFAGGSTGEGDLNVGNVIVSGAPLAHDGGVTFGRETSLESANTYSGPTTVRSNGGTVWVRHAQALGDASQVVTIAEGYMTLQAPVANDFVVTNGALVSELPSAAPGAITLAPGNGLGASLEGPGHFGNIVINSKPGGNVGLGSGIFDGVISGSGGFSTYGGTLKGDNTFTGVVRQFGGPLNVNHVNGLGSADAGTVVSQGELNLNAPVAEPILLTGYSTVNVNEQIEVLPLSSPGAEAKIRINAPGEYSETVDLMDNRLEINAETSIGGLYLRGANAGLSVAPGQTLHLGDAGLSWHSGALSGQISGSGALHKQGVTVGKLTGAFSYDGEVIVDRGRLEVATSGTTTTTLTAPSPYSSLWMVEGRTYDGDIHLLGNGANHLYGKDLYVADDQRDDGPLVLAGNLNVHGQAAISGKRVVVEGPVQGDSLIGYSTIELQNPNNNYTGVTNVRAELMSLQGEGRILNSSEILIERGGYFGLYNNTDSNLSDRVADSIPVTLRGGVVDLHAPNGMHSSESLGALTFAQSHSTAGASLGNDSSSAELTFASVSREAGSSAYFESNGQAQVKFDAAPSLSNGMIGAWATINGDSNRLRFASYGPNGVAPLNSYVSDLPTAGINDNVKLNHGVTLAADKTVNSITGDDSDGPIGSLELGGNRLTVMSGGVLSANVNNGEITAGNTAGAELIMTASVGNAKIVDNEAGLVNVVFPVGGRLVAANTYSGSTTLNSRELTVLSPQALPVGTELVLNGGVAKFYFDAHATVNLDQLVLRNGAEIQGNGYETLNPVTAVLESGRITSKLSGDGMLVKQGPETVVLFEQNADFHGTIVVENGTLYGYERGFGGAAISVSGGVLDYGGYEQPLSNAVTLSGGAFFVEQVSHTGPLQITAPSALLGGRFAGSISGNGDLAIESIVDGPSIVEFKAPNPNFHGNVAVNNGVLRVGPNSSLGSGDVMVGPSGKLELENSVASNDITLRGGELVSWGSQTAVTGLVTVEDRGFVGGGNADSVLSGGLRFTEDARLTKLGNAKLTVGGTVTVNGLNTIFSPLGAVEINGTIVPESEAAILDIVTGSFDNAPVSLSLTVPQNTSIGVRKFGGLTLVEAAGAGRFLSGNGLIENDVALRNRGELRPGASVGALTVDRNAEWGAGGSYEWEINDALGTPGGQQGWDALHVRGDLSITANSANPFVIEVRTLSAAGGAAMLANFDAFQNYAWEIASANDVFNFSPDLFAVDDAAFRALWGASPLGEFALDSDGSNVLITYAPASSISGDAWPFNGRIDLNDLNVVRNNFGQSGPLGMPGDVYPFDGRVDLNDVNLVRNHFGEQSAKHAVPEPSTLLLSLFASLGAIPIFARSAAGRTAARGMFGRLPDCTGRRTPPRQSPSSGW